MTKECKSCGKEMVATRAPAHGYSFLLKVWTCRCGLSHPVLTKKELDEWEKDFAFEIRNRKEKPRKNNNRSSLLEFEVFDNDPQRDVITGSENRCKCGAASPKTCTCDEDGCSDGCKGGCGSCRH